MSDLLDILSLGAGVQSSALFLMSCLDILPKLHCAVFADTHWEPEAVYRHFGWLQEMAARHGIPIRIVSAGDLRQDAIDFRRMSHSADGKRHASIPAFVKNADGSKGIIRRQCTGSYKIEPIERLLRREIVGLKPGQRSPKTPQIRQWLGISSDESRRAKAPGRMVSGKTKSVQSDLFGGKPVTFTQKVWKPEHWKTHCYPLLGLELWPDRRSTPIGWLPTTYSRGDCLAWLHKTFPGREFPRSACIGCPLRSNAEWREMRDNRPNEFADACAFDEAHRAGDAENASRKGGIIGTIYLHDSLVPLALADLGVQDHKEGSGCGVLWQLGQDGATDGMCGV